MDKGFIFNHNKCVNCGACRAACILENGWSHHVRQIYTFNSEASILLPVVNLSLACNHCEKPLCLEGCPANSYYRDSATGAVVIDQSKCIGCKYCDWNCPYDAPKFDKQKGVIAKCHLCYQLLNSGLTPACSDACPTGALKFGDTSGSDSGNDISWFPHKNINPSILITGYPEAPLRVVPETAFSKASPKINQKPVTEKVEWSLLIFSFLCSISVSVLTSSLLKGYFPDTVLLLSSIFLAGFASLFHLGKVTRSWRAIINLKSSPLSREIAIFLIFSALSTAAVIFIIPFLLIVSSIAGFVMLLIIDSVYIHTDKRRTLFYHSGQTFVSSLLITSFLTTSIIPFAFIAIIKIISAVYNIRKNNRISEYGFVIRFFRLSFLIIACLALLLGISKPEEVVIVIFLAGELLDRLIFYIDFEPVNINTLINYQLNVVNDEKKRG